MTSSVYFIPFRGVWLQPSFDTDLYITEIIFIKVFASTRSGFKILR